MSGIENDHSPSINTRSVVHGAHFIDEDTKTEGLVSLFQVPGLVNIRTTIVFSWTGRYRQACDSSFQHIIRYCSLSKFIPNESLGASLYCIEANQACLTSREKEDSLLSPSGNHYLSCVISYLAWMSPGSIQHLLAPVTAALPFHLWAANLRNRVWYIGMAKHFPHGKGQSPESTCRKVLLEGHTGFLALWCWFFTQSFFSLASQELSMGQRVLIECFIKNIPEARKWPSQGCIM